MVSFHEISKMVLVHKIIYVLSSIRTYGTYKYTYIYQIRPYTAIWSFPTISPVMVSEFTSPYVYGLLIVVLVNRAVLLFPYAKILVGQIFLQLKNEL